MYPSLPIDAHMEDIVRSVKSHAFTILTAAPGTGKTTRVPSALLDHMSGNILVLEPRRLAARVSAERVAQEKNEAIGQSIGYATRYERKSSSGTRLTYLTEGLLLQWVRRDPHLTGIDCVVLDEFHERNLHTDVALAAVRFVQKNNPSLRCLIMSATMDSDAIASQLPNVNCLDVPGKTYPLDVEFSKEDSHDDLTERVTFALRRMLNDSRCSGDILVFLPGIRQIQSCIRQFDPYASELNLALLPLSAQTPQPVQRQIFEKSKQRKIIFATNVAETSVTIPGVTGVIDSGLAKIAGHASWSGMPTLEVKKISRASCDQRAGRAGRTSSGVVYRLYSESDYLRREAEQLPEIHRVDLSATVLLALSFLDEMGQPQNVGEFPWLTPPQPNQQIAALQLLTYLGAVDAEHKLTELGKRMAQLPLHPRSGALYLKAEEEQMPALGLWAALIAESASRLRFQASIQDDLYSDVEAHLLSLKSQGHASIAPPLNILERDYGMLKKRLCPKAILEFSKLETGTVTGWLLAGYPDRVAKLQKRKLRSGDSLYHFCLGKSGRLLRGSHANHRPFIIALDATEELSGRSRLTHSVIHFAADVPGPELMKSHHRLARVEEVEKKEKKLQEHTLYRIHSYGNFSVEEKLLERAIGHEASLEEQLTSVWPQPFPNAEDLDRYHAKIQFLDSVNITHNLPMFDGEFFMLLVSHMCDGKKSLEEIKQVPLKHYIQDMLTYEQTQLLERQAPEQMRLKNGHIISITYEDKKGPQASAYIQDLFGLAEAPTVGDRHGPILWTLLAPNGRPAQMTQDLDGFWSRTYPELARELSRRYPKHHWPEEPRTAPAVRFKKQLK